MSNECKARSCQIGVAHVPLFNLTSIQYDLHNQCDSIKHEMITMLPCDCLQIGNPKQERAVSCTSWQSCMRSQTQTNHDTFEFIGKSRNQNEQFVLCFGNRKRATQRFLYKVQGLTLLVEKVAVEKVLPLWLPIMALSVSVETACFLLL